MVDNLFLNKQLNWLSVYRSATHSDEITTHAFQLTVICRTCKNKRQKSHKEGLQIPTSLLGETAAGTKE